ncbi:MAG: hypothetical protein IGS38_18630 [Synechococcales cyanobacterium M58_A2018_015]|nr:hypothetical protein [Synechococcales cyanobacterium M58_A2018_015]
MTLTVQDLIAMSQDELDELYRHSPVGAPPDGNSQGTALILPGTWLCRILVPLITLLAWQGKVFYREQQYLLNKVSPFRLRLVKAAIYPGESWIDGEATTVLDYSQTSFVAQKIRDEIREVAPRLYLGQAYWGKTRVLNFILQF